MWPVVPCCYPTINMCPNPPLESYAQDICAAAKLIDVYCLSAGLPYPSFDQEAPSITLPSTAPINILEARQKLVASAFKIQQLATEPSEFVPRLAIHVRRPNSLFLGTIG